MKLPCPQCPSSDAYHIYEDGHGYCFSCSTYFSNKEKEEKMTENNNKRPFSFSSLGGSYEDYPDKKGISVSACEKYGVVHLLDSMGEVTARAYPWPGSDGTIVAAQIRYLPKDFRTVGTFSKARLFGSNIFPSHKGMSITVTEGADDALAVYEMFGQKYPAVAIQSSSSVVRDISLSLDYLLGFKFIYLCFDNDDPGKEALRKACDILPPEKVRVVKLGKHKDAADYLVNGDTKAFVQTWHASGPPKLDGILSTTDDHWKALLAEPEKTILDYPYKKLQEKTYGVRKAELVFITAPTGVGKSELIRELEYHATQTTTASIGLLHFEDPPGTTHKRLLAKALEKRVYLPDVTMSDAERLDAFNSTFSTGRVHVLSAFGGYDFDGLIQRLRYMVSVLGCEIIFLDHITIALQSTTGGKIDVGVIDDAITRLRTLVHDLNFSLIAISHVNAEGDPRGSSNLKNLADTVIHLERDTAAGSCRTYITLRKNRFGGPTGKAGVLIYDEETGRLLDSEDQVKSPTPNPLPAYPEEKEEVL